jgi:hypothetical protein
MSRYIIRVFVLMYHRHKLLDLTTTGDRQGRHLKCQRLTYVECDAKCGEGLALWFVVGHVPEELALILVPLDRV